MYDHMTLFMEAMENWAEAREEYHEARRKYTGYSPDYALGRERRKLEEATAKLSECFTNAVKGAMGS